MHPYMMIGLTLPLNSARVPLKIFYNLSPGYDTAVLSNQLYFDFGAVLL